MTTLRSYVSGQWHTPDEDGRPLYDATTGAEVARITSAGVDMATALDHGRTVGGPALRALTFHQRAGLLKSLAAYLREHRDELYALSTRTGATLGDSKFDVDGGIGVLSAYASKGTRELPNSTVYVDGNVEPLGRGGTFVGQHICTSLHGVAVQVNAFNFPVWGPMEKFAPAFLAGVPGDCAQLGALQRRGRLAEHVRPGAGRYAGDAGVRSVRQAAGHRDDGEGWAEVHGYPARLRAGRAEGRRHRGGERAAGESDRRQSGPPRRADGAAG